MKRILSMAALMVSICGCAHSVKSDVGGIEGFQNQFNVKASDWSSTGRNDYFILEPGHKDVYRGEDGELIITVLNETKMVDGVETRVIEEHESEKGKVVEISRNYFAIDRATGDVYYFGESVDVYKDGKVSSHPGEWLSGEKGAKFGLFMPAKPRVGMKFQQESAPGVAMDRCEVVSVSETHEVPLGKFSHCVKIKETTPLESGKEYKIYAPKVGLLQDEELKLVEQTPAK